MDKMDNIEKKKIALIGSKSGMKLDQVGKDQGMLTKATTTNKNLQKKEITHESTQTTG